MTTLSFEEKSDDKTEFITNHLQYINVKNLYNINFAVTMII